LTAALPSLRVGLIHGRLKPDEKAATMGAFVRGELHVLAAPTAIEVGRGAPESPCVLLFEEPVGDVAKLRLKVVFENTDGFEIARQDLLIRGPGEFLGARQSGLPLLRFPDLERDVALIEQARDMADELLAREPAAAQAHLERWLGGRTEFIKA